ncbi:helix-hairpin-helix domain-containing protein [Halobellus sp. H-GB7]|uniref:helix-hairpin-helix domain-containing protein n=1 Tax=Halobellus sp. H-GB7 TaxID=3069756 RepID=UPI0027B7CC05|nr:helix-hairpin-helix domain-containing protein [Halobellus sp. H-GB7]MDQ2053201.1 helix-hairpin-helix domain-containing protein [Halobellus sp. H-GB7]
MRPAPGHRLAAADPKTQPDDAGDVDDTVADPKSLDVLQTISGVGRRRAQALINAGYESVGSLREAPVEEIAAVESVSESVAVQIKTDIEPSPTNKAALHSDGGYGVTD